MWRWSEHYILSSNKIFNRIIENISASEFFLNEQKKDIEELNNQELALINSIKESDSLQKVYQEVLRKSVEKAEGGETQITFEGSGKDNKTKEFELFQSDLELRRELFHWKKFQKFSVFLCGN